ncbi:F0F1 ATP synthase subunit A [Collinsella sp. zg1085]|uniref:F0F1 ATP synthase subunit A n=1 Tax=Collinsella sp. zg1085 TaxID=2844380 RepID=UPI001C0C99EC|nr:F0F1 ATP synthase subunit A [Collinsella sp. zg1085]QWT17724.1 F0F1 ATP synthase subunit A [Collinsella sp. zg1085]
MEAFEKLPGEINHMVSEFMSIPIVGNLMAGLTQYTFWLIVAAIVLLLLVFSYTKKIALVPHGIFANGMEKAIDVVSTGIGKQILGPTWKEHFPFLASLFFFILVNNIVGVIPGMKPGSGTISTTAAVAIVVFLYFVGVGIKKHGFSGYAKSLAPKGVSFPLNVLIWIIELISTILRPITLAVRLFCNMFAGHIVMGSFALMVALFAQPLLEEITALNVLGALPALAFAGILLVIYVIEIFVACVQAYVFTMLTAVYIQGAEAEGH